MSDGQFAKFCSRHPDINFEMTADGEIVPLAPSGFLAGASNFEIAGELRAWARKDGRGIGSDSSTGFVLPNGARRSPDASWTLKSRTQALDARKRPIDATRVASLH
jgi:Uma2 family endonuclease